MKQTILWFLCLCCGAMPGLAEEKYTLRYRWQEGETVSWDVEHRNRTTTMVAHQTEAVDTYSHSRKDWKVVSVDTDGTGTIENSVPWADMREKTGENPLRTFDSRKEMIPSEGFETVPESLGRTLSRISINSRGKQVAREDFHTTTIVQQANLAYVCIEFPEDAIPVGYSWSKQYPVYVPQPTGTLRRIEMLQKFTLEKVENGIATITYGTKILTPLSDAATKAQIIDRLYSGTFLFDVARGRAIMLTQKVDETVLGFRGEVSRVKMLIEFHERLIFE